MDRPFGRYGIPGRGGPCGDLYFGADLSAQQFSCAGGSKCRHIFVDGTSWDAGLSCGFCDFPNLFLLDAGRSSTVDLKEKFVKTYQGKGSNFVKSSEFFGRFARIC